ncbi:phosphoglycerate kinase [Halobaculum sp. P14]|uniref:phosphoglycerate kinase n=1 Tax=Halobaculum sp. P14 TaxID=3421638 RepID=UPI003EBE9F1D
MSSFRTLDDLPAEQRVLVRLDLNSPVEDGAVQDNRRFSRHAETVAELAAAGHRVALMAHQGRPGRDTFVSLEQHADILADHAGVDVDFVADTYGDDALAAIRSFDAGDVLLLENTRMTDDELPEKPPEAHAESAFVETLAPEFDAYVNDAYSAAHREHASIVGFPLRLPSYAGRVMEAEYEANTAIASREFDGDVTMVVGGTKATDVIGVMEALDETVDQFLLGGVAGELFLRAAGYPVGHDVDTDLFDDQWERNEDTIRAVLDERRDQIRLASDLAYEDDDGDRAEVAVDDVDEKQQAFLDVGSDTVADYEPVIHGSDAVFVKGALGVFEDERFSVGTVGVLSAIAETDCFSVVGGGDTSRAIELYGLDEDDYSHVSIAGGAYIRALTGEPLPAVELLERNAAGDFDV